MAKISTRDAHHIAKLLANREAFETFGALSGRPGTTDTGRLPGDWARTYRARGHVISYTIRSYATPVAWLDSETGEWIMPDESYSVTTTRHQSRIRYALYLTGDAVTEA
jgi:hypothetical protein